KRSLTDLLPQSAAVGNTGPLVAVVRQRGLGDLVGLYARLFESVPGGAHSFALARLFRFQTHRQRLVSVSGGLAPRPATISAVEDANHHRQVARVGVIKFPMVGVDNHGRGRIAG